MYGCAVENLCTIRLSVIYHDLSHLGKKTDYSLTLRFQTRTFSNPPALKYSYSSQLASVESHYSLIFSTVKILNTLFQLAHLRNTVPVS